MAPPQENVVLGHRIRARLMTPTGELGGHSAVVQDFAPGEVGSRD